MKKELTSAEAAAVVYGSPGTKVTDRFGDDVSTDAIGRLQRTDKAGAVSPSGCTIIDGCALSFSRGPFTIPSDPDELPEDVTKALDDGGYLNHCVHDALAALWRHIKPEAKR